jgi:riboflavin synthase
MFTGIIQSVGAIEQLQPIGGDLRIRLHSGALDMHDVALGDSIACNGICLTVVEFGKQYFVADVSSETIRYSTIKHWQQGQQVNLEKALLITTRLGGHMVSGHVDGVAKITECRQDARALYFELTAPPELCKYIAHKGSITLDGISLTVNKIVGQTLSLTLVPHTAANTNIGSWQTGIMLNIEVDVIARYLEKLLLGNRDAKPASLTMDKLAGYGFIK